MSASVSVAACNVQFNSMQIAMRLLHLCTVLCFQRRYTAPPNQAGLQLSSVIGYNGNGQDNMVWCPDSGEWCSS